MNVTRGAAFAPHLLSLLRVVAAGTFFTHGSMKLFSWPAVSSKSSADRC